MVLNGQIAILTTKRKKRRKGLLKIKAGYFVAQFAFYKQRKIPFDEPRPGSMRLSTWNFVPRVGSARLEMSSAARLELLIARKTMSVNPQPGTWSPNPETCAVLASR